MSLVPVNARSVSHVKATTSTHSGVGRFEYPGDAGVHGLLAEHAERLSGQLAEAEAELTELREGGTGRISIRYFATAGVALVPPAVAMLRREQPRIEIDLKLVDPGDPLPDVEKPSCACPNGCSRASPAG